MKGHMFIAGYWLVAIGWWLLAIRYELKAHSQKFIVCLLLLLLPAAVGAQPAVTANATTCSAVAEKSLAKEQRLYRSVLFGAAKAVDAPVSEVRYDRDGIPWIKEKDNAWKTVAEGKTNETRTDGAMDEHDELSPRRGIFQTKRVATSDLVPSLVQAYRTFKCRSVQVCKTIELSLTQEASEPQDITVTVPGCTEEKRKTFVGCHLIAGDDRITDQADALTYCRSIQSTLIAREKELLKTATEYDASYRSLLQLSGQMDAFLQEFRWPMVNGLRKAVQMIGALKRIPCFIGSCDESPPTQ